MLTLGKQQLLFTVHRTHTMLCDSNYLCCYLLLHVAKAERSTFLECIATHGGRHHAVGRETLFDDVIRLYETKGIEKEFPFRVHFTGERAVDTGGVGRDLFSGFFEECYVKLFDGGLVLTPFIHPHMKPSQLKSVRKVISHAYLDSGVFPIRIAFPCLAAILLTMAKDIPARYRLEALVDSLSVYDAGVLKRALEFTDAGPNCRDFPSDIQSSLLPLLSHFGCREVPRPSNLKSIVADVSQYEFIVKPAAAITAIRSGVPELHSEFLAQMSINDLHSIYSALAVSQARVLAMIEEPEFVNCNEERVWGYLTQFVGSMTQDELQAFVRFVTGASVCLSQHIRLIFNTLDGFARRPTSHTCSSTLELPVSYKTFPEFVVEFRAILSDSNSSYTWIMDAV